MKKDYVKLTLRGVCALLLALCLRIPVIAQTGQLDITRVTQMNNMPAPYLMRDWKTVTIQYDSFIYYLNATGQYLPLMHLKSAGTNYPSLQPILLDSYVGVTGAGAEAEAINIIPSVVGASLMGVDKTNQYGNNWVLKTKDFFNKANGQNVYLNGYSSATGSDWWYDLMPNVFFYQLYSLYPTTQDFDTQFTTVADRWLAAVNAMGGSTTPWTVPNMDHRAFNLATMTPNDNGVHEPEGAGTIAWLLYNAYLKTSNKKYLDGAQLAISFLSGLNFNPAYEIELPYGTFVAARMNAELGTNYDVGKMINWSFNLSSERNWGTVVGTWGDGTTGNNDVSGLVGEIDNPSTGYAFTMNGFEQAATLVPLAKYDKRYARTVAKWVLNLANASRLFYSAYLPSSHQDSYGWSVGHDPKSVIAYEALKQTSLTGVSLFATGDAIRTGGGQTNLGIYGSSHVGYLAAVVQKTDVDGILMLDVNKTDFFGANSFPSYIVYNPLASDQQVTLPLGSKTYDLYDALSETVIKTSATGNQLITVPANQAVLLVYLPQGQGSQTVASNGKLYLGDKIVDYHYGYNFTGTFRIRSVASTDSLVEYNQHVSVYSSVENASGPVTYNWYVNGALAISSPDSVFHWTVPASAGPYWVRLTATSGASSATDSLAFSVVQHIPIPPVIRGFSSDTTWYYTNGTAVLTCHASNSDGTALRYTWSVPAGSIISQTDSVLHWTAPSTDGIFSVTCTVKNADSLTTSGQQAVLVKKATDIVATPVAYYPLDGDVLDYSGNGHNATENGVQLTADARGIAAHAYKFSDGSDIIDVPNATSLNFQDQTTLSFWLELDAVLQESYVISHGSYQQRWKVSVIPNNKLRWTVKSTNTVTDLDTSFPLQLNHFYHFTVVYTGYSMEIYADGVLDSYVAITGLIGVATDDITFGRETVSTESYSLFGTLDEVRIYDKEMGPNEIITLKTLWNTTKVTGVEPGSDITVYPNPARLFLHVAGLREPVVDVGMMDIAGRKIKTSWSGSGETLNVEFDRLASELVILKIETATSVVYRKVMIMQ